MNPTGSAEKRRAYHAPNRIAAARQTRRRICASATELFLSQGYASTSIRTIAIDAGVAEKTVYLQFASKSALLQAVVERTTAAEADRAAVDQQPWYHEVLALPDPAEKLRRLVAVTADLHQRTGAVFAMARAAAAVDPQAAALWNAGKQGHRAEISVLATHLQQAGLLPAGTDIGWATTSLVVLLGPESWLLVRGELGLSDAGYRGWLHTTLERALLNHVRGGRLSAG